MPRIAAVIEDESLNHYRKPDIERLKIARNDSMTLWKNRMLSIENWVEYAQSQFFYQKFYKFVENRHGWDAAREACIRFPGEVDFLELRRIRRK